MTLAQRILAGVNLILLVGCAVLAYLYLANQGRKAELNAALVPLQATIARANAAAESANASDPLLRTPAFPRDPPDLALASAVLASATDSGVSTGPIQTTTGNDEKIGNDTYRATTINLTIAGSLPRILNFFDRLEQTGPRTIVFDNIRVVPSDGQWTVQLQITVYSQAE